MKPLLILLAILVLFGSLHAEGHKSPKLAMLCSAIVPGGGELYGGNYTKASIFLSTEAAAWLTYARLGSEVNWAKSNYMKYANMNAGVPLHSSDELYNLMEDYMSSDDYNREVELNIRNNLVYLLNDPSVSQADRENYANLLNNPVYFQNYFADYLYTGDRAWTWNSEKSYHKFYEMRKDKQELMIYRNFAVSAMILNRVVSIVDAALVTRKWNNFHEKYGQIEFQPDFRKKGVNLVYTKHF